MLSWLPNRRRQCPRSLPPTAEQLEHAERTLLKRLQTQQFPIENALLSDSCPTPAGLRQFGEKHPIPTGSPLRRLNPIMDQDGLLRVGGRLSLSPFDSAAKFPYIIANHPIAVISPLRASADSSCQYRAHSECSSGTILDYSRSKVGRIDCLSMHHVRSAPRRGSAAADGGSTHCAGSDSGKPI